MKHDIITIGSVTRDNFLKMDFKLIDWPKAPEGKAIVLPFGEKIYIDEVHSTVGGNSANASVTFARQGYRVACFGKIGDDVPGREIIAHLRREKVDPLFSVCSDARSAYSALLIGQKGERTILNYHGASDTMARADIPWKKLKSRWWYLSLAGESDKFLKPFVAFAKKHDIQVAFNPSGHHILHKRREIISSLKNLSFLVLNRGEAADLVQMSFKKEREVFKKLDDLMPGIVAVTDGPNGVTVSDGKYLYKAGIFKEKKIVDRTGAGDSFGSGFVAGLMARNKESGIRNKGFSPEDIKYAIRLASANATSVVEHMGATEGTLTKKQFENDRRWRAFKIRVTQL